MEKALEIIISKQFIWSGVLVIAAGITTRLITHAYKAYMKKSDKDIKTYAFVRTVFRAVKLVVWMLFILAILDVNDINVTSIVAGVGVAGAVFGLAMQDVIKDVLMGIHIVNDHSFQVGDVIRINDDTGIVTMFTLQTTQYTSLNTGDKVTICNRDITKVALASTMLDINMPLSYSENPDRVREVFKPCAERIAKIPGIKSAEYLGISDYESSAVIYKIRLHANPKDHWAMKRAALAEIQRTVIREGIEIPFNQLDVNVKK
ncbi:MAG: mechanosensitive ion channel family protein [Clostridiales bacterium]|nr:mechanosensitive ion channel family protein [Candidatus Crickella merdequi]